MTTQREKRIASARRQVRAEKIRATLKWSAVGAVALAVVAGAAYGVSLIPDPPKTVHWHPTWEVFVQEQNVRWASPRFDMQYMGGATHFHQPDDNTIHAEGKTDRLYLGRLFVALGAEIEDERITLPEGVMPASGTFESNGTDPLRVFVQPFGEDWRELDGGFAGLSFEDKMRILVTYGDLTQEQIARQQASVKEAPQDAASAMRPTSATPPP